MTIKEDKKEEDKEYQELEKIVEELDSPTASAAYIFTLICVMSIAALVQHATIQLFIAKLPGNKFYNGILFGLSEALAMIVSNMLMLYL